MLNLKKTAVAVLALGSSAAFAGTMGPVCTAGNVTVPCERNAWEFGIYALYLKAHYNNDFSWVAATTVAPAGLPSTTTFVDTDMDAGWGFRLEAAYHFLTGNDLNLNWTHFSHDSDETFLVGADTVFFDPLAGAGTYTFDADPRWDAVNLEFGQHVDFGEFKNIRFHGGVQYARIRTNTTITGVDTTGVAFLGSAYQTARFNGFGPRAGADMSFDWGNGIGIYAKPAAAVLVGRTKFSGIDTLSTATGLSVYGDRDTIVPEVEAKLGITYTYAMAQGDLMLDAGWMWVNYFNALDGAATISVPVGATTVTGSVPGESDFGVSGPYIGLKWIGSVV
ncbi:major outer membrane protein (plasmid) [Legionella adelaidensis]|uniref:Major outer membrane protein n=1 Tax=Legionella adelaidensis TaxID=45056 RepID=A0A0W0R130_9GAMM|nr:Lpg1974 family pore-forming outer membrane protein [Legionella adelaidensis]KTC64757.1 major outer membrane protein [Legionella adelaidensis]VEH81315.1 major outer membrane protein [Legionella adelaidensis]